MIVCPHCTTSNIPNTLFCELCGADLRPGAPPPAAPQPASAPAARPQPKLYCLVVDRNQWVPIPDRAIVVIGRADSSTGSLPDFDLGPFQGARAGVSRRHAQLHRNDYGLLLEDLGSMNGTFINDQRLPPNRPVALPQGAKVRLGLLKLRFEFREDS